MPGSGHTSPREAADSPGLSSLTPSTPASQTPCSSQVITKAAHRDAGGSSALAGPTDDATYSAWGQHLRAPLHRRGDEAVAPGRCCLPPPSFLGSAVFVQAATRAGLELQVGQILLGRAIRSSSTTTRTRGSSRSSSRLSGSGDPPVGVLVDGAGQVRLPPLADHVGTGNTQDQVGDRLRGQQRVHGGGISRRSAPDRRTEHEALLAQQLHQLQAVELSTPLLGVPGSSSRADSARTRTCSPRRGAETRSEGRGSRSEVNRAPDSTGPSGSNGSPGASMSRVEAQRGSPQAVTLPPGLR